MQYCVVTFHSVHDALHFEKTLKKAGLNLQLIPVPREISSSCGIAAKFSPEERNKFEQAILQENLEIEQIYLLENLEQKKGLLNFFN